jgi:hypothetical protein
LQKNPQSDPVQPGFLLLAGLESLTAADFAALLAELLAREAAGLVRCVLGDGLLGRLGGGAEFRNPLPGFFLIQGQQRRARRLGSISVLACPSMKDRRKSFSRDFRIRRSFQ